MGPKPVCINPNFIWVQRGPKWEQQPVACRQCWRCKQNRVNDYVARSMAEASTSEICCTVSLTYAPRADLADKVLHPSHFQLFMKLLRRAGHKVRYLVAGEYGDLKSRAHFHAILFFTDLLPLEGRGITPRYKADYPEGFSQEDAPFCREIPQKRMVHIREWPHGHIIVDWSFDERSVHYVCKYLLDDDKNNAWFSLSKKPPLGAEWFARKAKMNQDLGVLPSGFEYLPPGGSRDKPYLMTGATRRDYLNAITMDPEMRLRMSEWVQKTFDKHHRARLLADLEAQPPEIIDAIINQRRADEAEREEIGRYLSRERLADYYDKLIQNSDGTILLKHHGKYLPKSEVLKMREDENGKAQE